MDKIKDVLAALAQKENVKILFACETGSRAWGFPSPDSDYDVRFIYMHKRDWYLSLSQHKETIEYMYGDLDITGWDLRKSLQLLKKSNAPLIERFQSPITYYADKNFKEDFKDLIQEYYSPTAVFFHHYSLAKKFWMELTGNEEVRLKSFFYLIRSMLSCHWIVRHRSVLPMDIEGLMSIIDAKERDYLRELIRLKAKVGQRYLHRPDNKLSGWMEELWKLLDCSKNSLGVSKADNTALTKFFLKMVNTNADN